MNVLVLQGSPRANGNTAWMAEMVLGITGYWECEDAGIVTAQIDEQKTDATRAKILELVRKL